METYLSLLISPEGAREMWCVGHYREDGVWVSRRTYTVKEEAEKYARCLNHPECKKQEQKTFKGGKSIFSFRKRSNNIKSKKNANI
jgi:hypothetical protein